MIDVDMNRQFVWDFMAKLVFPKYNVNLTQELFELMWWIDNCFKNNKSYVTWFLLAWIKKDIVKIFMIEAGINGQFMRFYGKFDISQVLSKSCIIWWN